MQSALGFLYDTLEETLRQVRRAQLFMVASSLAYTTILSVIPLIAVSFAVFQIFGGMENLYVTIQNFLISNLAEGMSDQAVTVLEKFIQNAHTKTVGISGLIGLGATSFIMLSSIEQAINRIWDVPIQRNWFWRISSYCLLITIGPLALAVALGIATSMNFPIANLFPNGTGIFAITTLFLTATYQLVPHTPVPLKYSFVSGLLAATIFSIAHVLYHLYISKIISYHRLYGRLSAVPILLLWVYILWLIILAGAAFTAALQKTRENRRITKRLLKTSG
jgi:membrane protein